MHTLQISIMQDVIEPNSLYLESNYYGLRENKQLKYIEKWINRAINTLNQHDSEDEIVIFG